MRGTNWGAPPGPRSPRDLLTPPSGPSGLPLDRATYNVFPGWLYPPRGAVRFNHRSLNASVAATGVAVLLPHDDIVWSQGQIAVLSTYEVCVIDATEALDLFFTIRLNGAPIPGLDQIRPISADVEAAITGDTVYLPLGQGGALTVTAQNDGAGAFDVSAQLTGWTYSAQDISEVAEVSAYLARR